MNEDEMPATCKIQFKVEKCRSGFNWLRKGLKGELL
jgi:hypothetical protein